MSAYNPALLRLELLAQGMKVDPGFNKELGGALKEPLWTRTGPTSTGMDLRLEQGMYCSPAIEGERFPWHSSRPARARLFTASGPRAAIRWKKSAW